MSAIQPILGWLWTVQRTLDKDCRQAEEPKQLVDEASRFHLGRQHQHSAVIRSGALLLSSRVLHPSLVTLCSPKAGRCVVNSTMRLISGTLHCTALSRHVYRFRSVTMAAAKCEMRSILIIIELSYCIIIVIILIYRIVYRSKTVFDIS